MVISNIVYRLKYSVRIAVDIRGLPLEAPAFFRTEPEQGFELKLKLLV